MDVFSTKTATTNTLNDCTRSSTITSSRVGRRNNNNNIVIHEILSILDSQDEYDALCDVKLMPNDSEGGIPAIKFILAVRSNVFRKMLYGKFYESDSDTIQLNYSTETIQALVYFCSFNKLPEDFNTNNNNNNKNDNVYTIILKYIELAEAADFFQLSTLLQNVETTIINYMITDPKNTVCYVYEHSTTSGRNIQDIAIQMIETRPYITLLPIGITHLTKNSLYRIMKNKSIAVSETFLLQVLIRWYQLQSNNTTNNNNTIDNDVKYICEKCIQLDCIEPSILLAITNQYSSIISKEIIFKAISKQAIQASYNKVWNLDIAPRSRIIHNNNTNNGTGSCGGIIDRIVVEGCVAIPECNGIYYRVAKGNDSDLFSKTKELSTGQQYLYTISRCLKVRNNNNTNNNNDIIEPYYDCRIFCTKFLTHYAIKKLQSMQISGIIIPYFQPIVQLLHILPPAAETNNVNNINNNNNYTFINDFDISSEDVPTPIRKYYRTRISDGELHMQATISNDLMRKLFLKDNIQEHDVIQIQEFGVYNIHGYAAIHIIKANIVMTNTNNNNTGTSTTTLYKFGNPKPIGLSPTTQEQEDDFISTFDSNDKGGVQNLYTCQYSVRSNNSNNNNNNNVIIPKHGWIADEHGIEPAPTCTWIPVFQQQYDNNIILRSNSSTMSSSVASFRSCSNTSPKTTISKKKKRIICGKDNIFYV